MRRIKKTKIIATLGPSSSSKDSIEMLIKEGADVLRINFSHSTHKEAKSLIKHIRKINEELNTNTSILADLQGPKLRIGEIKANTSLSVGDEIEIKTGKEFVGDKNKIYVDYKSLPSDVDVGEKILIDDGKIILKVLDTNKKKILRGLMWQNFLHISVEGNASIKRDQYRFYRAKDGKDVTNKVDIV